MGTFDAGTLNGDPVTFKTTVHGPVTGYATVNGKKVAISSKRSSYGEDVLDLLFNRRISNGQVHDPKSFFNAAAKTPQTFNSFYIDNKHVAEYTAGKLPIRADGVDSGPARPRAPASTSGRASLSKNDHPHGIDPKDGTMTNWNQVVAKGFGSADDEWGRAGSAERVDLLDKNLDAPRRQNGKWTLADGDLGDERRGDPGHPGDRHGAAAGQAAEGTRPRARAPPQMLQLMVDWKNDGGSRLDLDNDGEIDAPGRGRDGRLLDEHRQRVHEAAARLRSSTS